MGRTSKVTRSGVAYETWGSGVPDIVFVPDGLLPLAALRQFPAYARFLEGIGRLGRLVLFDRRGIGASRAAGRGRVLTLADWADDARDVLASVGADRAVVVGLAEGAMTAVALAARHPDRVAALVLVNATPGPSLPPLCRRGGGPAWIDYLRSTLATGWLPELPGLELVAPSIGRDPSFSAWLASAFRQAGDARRFLPVFDLALRSEVRTLLPFVEAPTLVVHRRFDAWFSADHGRTLASGIVNARFLELPGADHAPYVGPADEILGAISWYLAEVLPPPTAREATRSSPTFDQPLTARQREVLGLVALGLCDKEIATRLRLSPRTVQKHLELAYRRLGVNNRTAAAFATRQR